jgi:hypothetical protein
MSRALLVLSAVVLFAACSSASFSGSSYVFNQEKRTYIQQNDLSAKDSVHVMDGRIYRGMPTAHAMAALGEPTKTDTSTWKDNLQVKYTYRSRPNAFDPGTVHNAYVYATNEKVTRWENLDKIPRFDAYYEGGM